LSRIEHGTMSGVTLQVIATLADVLEISVDHLLGRKDSDAVEPQPAGVAVSWSPETTPAEECGGGDSSVKGPNGTGAYHHPHHHRAILCQSSGQTRR
jgi:hypothetical protein